MSKKNLLNESTIRKFMKLASIEPLASDFLGRIQEAEEELEEGRDKEELDEAEEDLEEGRDKDDDLEEGRDKDDMDEAKDDDDLDERSGMEFKHDDDLDERGDMMYKDDEDMDMDMDLGAEEPAAEAGGMVSVDQLMSALERALEDVLGQEVEVSQDGEEEAELDAGPELDMDADAEMDMAVDADEEEDDLAESIYKSIMERISKQKKK